MNKVIEGLLLNILGSIVNIISPELRAELLKAVASLEAKAKTTATPIDDIFVKVLKVLLIIP